MTNIKRRDWKDIASWVRGRDNRTCQPCGMDESDHDSKPHVRHIKPVSDFDGECEGEV